MNTDNERDAVLEWLNREQRARGRHRRPGPVQDASQRFVMAAVGVVCLSVVLWAAVTVAVHLMGWL